MLLALLSIAVATTLALSFVSASSTAIGVARNVERHAVARHVAESGLELAIAYIRANDSWRTDRPHGTWLTNESWGPGTFTVVATDGADADGNGIIANPAEGDGDLADDESDLVTLTVTGRANGNVHVVNCVITPSPGSSQVVLFVVHDSDNLTAADQVRKSLIEAWGYDVELATASNSASVLTAAAAEADVVYITEDIASTDLGTKLRDTTTGVVNEDQGLCDDFQISNSGSGYTGTAIDVTATDHYITSVFALGSLTILSGNSDLNLVGSSMAAGAQTLAERPSSSTASLVAIEAGGSLSGGGSAAGRRVYLPWGGTDFDVTLLNEDGKTLMKRAIQWAATAPDIPSPVVHYNFSSGSGTTVRDQIGSLDLQLDAGNGSFQWVSDIQVGSGLHFNQDGQSGTACARTADSTEPDSLKSTLQSSQAFTLQAFVKAEVFDNSYGRMISYSRDTGNTYRNFTLAADNDGAATSDLIGRVKGSSSATESKIDNIFNMDDYTVLAFTVDLNQSSSNVKLYVDGELVRTSSLSGNFNSWTSEYFLLGNECTRDRPFRGTMFDVKIWDEALSAAQLLLEAQQMLPADDGTAELIALYEFNEVLPNPTLSGQWTLDETSGTTATDGVNGVDGDYNNGVVLGEAGVHGTAATFDGSNDYVEIPHSDAFLLDSGTVSFWFKSDEASTTQGLFSKDSTSYDTGGHLHIYTGSSRVNVRLQSTSASYTVQTGSIVNDTWYHVVFTFGSGGMKLYLNGTLADSDSYNGGTGSSSGGTGNHEPIALGANAWNSGDLVVTPLMDYFSGQIDDVRVYDWALESGQISNLNSGLDIGPPTGPGAVVADTSNYGTALDLTVADTDHITWLGGGGLEFTDSTIAISSGAASKLYTALTDTDEMTLEVIFTPANVTQGGPARIVSYSDGAYVRNFTLGQEGQKYIQRLRTSTTTTNGMPNIESADVLVADSQVHLVVTSDGDNVKMYRGGSLDVTEERTGTFNWSSSYEFMLGNETGSDRAWLGQLHRVAIYDRALIAAQVDDLFNGLSPRDPSVTGYDYTVEWVEQP